MTKSVDPGIDCSKDEVLTQQSSRDDADINVIVARCMRGAMLPENGRQPIYGDFTAVPTDLRECLEIVRKADEAFMSLDAHVRRRFDNDPVKLMDFLNDSRNRVEAISLGLVVAPKEPVVEAPVDVFAKESSGAKKSKAKADDE